MIYAAYECSTIFHNDIKSLMFEPLFESSRKWNVEDLLSKKKTVNIWFILLTNNKSKKTKYSNKHRRNTIDSILM